MVVSARNSVVNAQITVSKLASKPSSISQDVTGTVYNYVQFDKTNLDDTSVSSATIKFKVPKSWITANNMDDSTVSLYRYSSSTWNKLVTSKSAEDTDNFYYEAATPGFSVFAIAAQSKGNVSTPSTTTTGNQTTGGQNATSPSPLSQLFKGSNTWIVIVVLVVIIAGVIIYLVKTDVINLGALTSRRSSWDDLKKKYRRN